MNPEPIDPKMARVAVECIKAQMRKVAFEANQYRLGVSTGPLFESAWKTYQKRAEALMYFMQFIGEER
jgi:hypothetical protein